MFTSILSGADLWFVCMNVKRGLLLLFAFHLLTSSAAAQSDRDVQLLEPDKPVERELAGGQSHSYRIALTAGQYLRVVAEQRGIDVVVTLFGPDGKQIIEVDSPEGENGPERVAVLAETSGGHHLNIRSLEKAVPAGRYQIKIEELRTATELDKLSIAGERIFTEAEELRADGKFESRQNAIKKYEEALPLFHATADRDREAFTLTIIGSLYNSFGEKRKAQPYFEKALPIFTAVGNKQGEVIALNNLGVLHSTFGENKKALEYYERALPIQQTINDKYGEAVTRHNIGKVHWNVGNTEKSLQYYEQALKLRKETGDKDGETLTLLGIGSVYWGLAAWQKALQYFDEALKLSRTRNDKVAESAILHNIGGVYRDLGELREAIRHFEQALSLQQTIKDQYGEALTLIAIGLAHHYLREPQKALQYYQQALPILRIAGDKRTEASTLGNIAAVYQDFGNRQDSLRNYEQALVLLREAEDKVAEAITLNNIASTYQSLGERDKALEYFQQSLLLSRWVKDRRGEARTLGNLMVLWAELKNPHLAIFLGKQCVKAQQALRSNIRGLDKSVQQTYLHTVIAPYRELAHLLITQNRLSEAHQILNRFRDQEFYDYFARQDPLEENNASSLSISLTTRETQAERKLQSFLDQVEGNLANESAPFHALLRELDLEFRRNAVSTEVIQTTDTADMQQTLRDLTRQSKGKAVALYTLGGKETFRALVLTSERLTSISVSVSNSVLNSKLRQLWGLLQSDTYDPRVLSHDLYNVIFKPIKEKLPPETKTILWSLDGNLRYLPMGVLYDGQQYLVERYNHVNFTRADSERMTRAPSRQWTGLGLGSSQGYTVELLGTRHRFEELPGVAAELRAVFRTAGRAGGVLEGEVLPDDKFTKSAMLAELARRRPVVHIASHFSFRPGDETRSFLLLGDGSVLTLAEMKAQRDLFGGVELLTLSACNTAAQQADADGREIDAFAELAQRLGANAVMATLWPLADESAPWLMQEFYRQRQAGAGMMKAEALRKAQLALLGGSARINTSNKARDAGRDRARVMVVRAGSQRGQSQTRADIIYIETKHAPPYKREKQKPFAHPHYWAPVILIGNLR
jgi:CHAT domain-containing protein/tetratricopeptide (TPR) repeat protein